MAEIMNCNASDSLPPDKEADHWLCFQKIQQKHTLMRHYPVLPSCVHGMSEIAFTLRSHLC